MQGLETTHQNSIQRTAGIARVPQTIGIIIRRSAVQVRLSLPIFSFDYKKTKASNCLGNTSRFGAFSFHQTNKNSLENQSLSPLPNFGRISPNSTIFGGDDYSLMTTFRGQSSSERAA
jgi:hypothetical protein